MLWAKVKGRRLCKRAQNHSDVVKSDCKGSRLCKRAQNHRDFVKSDCKGSRLCKRVRKQRDIGALGAFFCPMEIVKLLVDAM